MNTEFRKRFRWHSLHLIVVLILGVTIGSVVVGFILQNNSLTQSLDNFFYEVIHKGFRHPVIDFLIKPFNYNFLPSHLSPGRMPSYYYFMILFALGYLLFKKPGMLIYAMFCFIVGTFIAQLITTLDWHFVFRNRPFLSLPNTVDEIGQNAWRQLSSYPSGHARETSLYATIISSFIPKLKWVMLGFLIFIIYSRVYIGAHYLTDTIAGALIGFFTAKTVLIAAREIQIVIEGKGETHESKPQEQGK